MSYTPTNWQTGDTITAEKLNNIESGIAAASEVYVININSDANGLYLGNREATNLFLDILPQYGKPMCFVQTPLEEIYPVSISYHVHEGAIYADCIEIWKTGIEKIIFERSDIPETGNYYGKVDTGVFTVTLTPTAQDFSGTMDKLPGEIAAAFTQSYRIVLRIPSLNASAEATQFIGNSVACANVTYDIGGQDVLIQIVTSASDSTYSTKIFPLTPMS